MNAGDNQGLINMTRRAGVLLHPTSLPVSEGNGDFGHQAYRFIEFLNACGFKVWQMLPLGPTHEDKSPYQCLSSHAGNRLLISLDWLVDKGWLNLDEIQCDESAELYRDRCLQQAYQTFSSKKIKEWKSCLEKFSVKHDYWLDDYALFTAFKTLYQDKPWYEWPEDVRHRDTQILEITRKEQQQIINQVKFEQFVFFTQWHEIREYAKNHDVEIFGDMPIFVAHDSADVWAHRENFLMDSDGRMSFVSGVPPDAFSDTGQRWGNPLYDWDYMKVTGFKWWIERFTSQLELFDMIRIDHFRGLQACWKIPFTEETAINGIWEEVPGSEMIYALQNSFDNLPLVAEDLGVITDEVIKLKKSFNLPGMKVLQFAFDGNNANPHLPHSHETNDVVYTGTHDNDTTLGWLKDNTNFNKEYFESYTGINADKPEDNVMKLIRLAMSSVSFLCVIPMQDILCLDSQARMNIPGTTEDNWIWRFDWKQLSTDITSSINNLITVYQR